MANPRRGLPEVWVTSLVKLLAGDDFCEFAAWYGARYWLKSDGEFDRAGWIAEHTAMLRDHVARLRSEGYTGIAIEKQNAFTLIGKTAKLSGKPDILATRDTEAVVSDVKTGQKRKEHLWQILIYLVALPRVRPDLAGFTWRGELVYKDERVWVDPHEVTPEAQNAIMALMARVGFGIPPTTTPSESECSACRLTVDDCREKANVAPRATGETVEF